MRVQATIDINILDSKDLGIAEKIFYMDICTHDKLFNPVEYFSNKYNLSKQIVTSTLNKLIQDKLIKKQIVKNKVYLQTMKVDEYKKFIDEYFKMYNDKAFEILGSRVNKNGKKYYPRWGQKEGRLLKEDLELHGYEALLDYAVLFFYDKVDTVKQFTRGKTKAGYGYNIFHSVIDKLEMSGIKVPEKCPECGMYWRHAKDCKLIRIQHEKEIEEIEEIKKLKEKYNDISLVDMFNEKLGRKII